MANVGYKAKLEISLDDSTWHALPVKTFEFQLNGNPVEIAELATNEGYQERVLTLRDWSVSVSDGIIKQLAANNQAFLAAEDILLNPLTVTQDWIWVRISPLGIATGLLYYKGKAVPENKNDSFDVSNIQIATSNYQANGRMFRSTHS